MAPGDITKSEMTTPTKIDPYERLSAAGQYAAGAGQAAQRKNWLGGIGGGASAGAAIGSLFAPGVGTAIGAGVGALAGGVMTALSPEEEEEDTLLLERNLQLQNRALQQQVAQRQRSMDWMTKLGNRFKYR